MIIPVGPPNPLGLVTASLRTLESDADPSQPGQGIYKLHVLATNT